MIKYLVPITEEIKCNTTNVITTKTERGWIRHCLRFIVCEIRGKQ